MNQRAATHPQRERRAPKSVRNWWSPDPMYRPSTVNITGGAIMGLFKKNNTAAFETLGEEALSAVGGGATKLTLNSAVLQVNKISTLRAVDLTRLNLGRIEGVIHA
jgi:hypothetical protein